jgi:hypothetical protein
MPTALIPPLLLVLGTLTARARHLTRPARDSRSRVGRWSDAGATTLELVIIALGLIAVATLLVVAITAAVTRRTNQIN